MFAALRVGPRFSKIFSRFCYSTALCSTAYLSYKYNKTDHKNWDKKINAFSSSAISRLCGISPFSFQAQCASRGPKKKAVSLESYLADLASDEITEHFHLMDSIEDTKRKISANKLLDVFRAMYLSGGDISLDFLQEMFYTAGVEDDRIAVHLFHLMDRNCDGVLQPNEIMAVLTLFSGGNATQRFKFLFRCLDLDGGGTVDKAEFRATLTAILEAQYHLGGLTDPFDHDEIFSNVQPHEYHTVAKFKSNRIVRDIFIVADTNRDGELSLKEFLHWCRTGSKEVRLLESALLSSMSLLE